MSINQTKGQERIQPLMEAEADRLLEKEKFRKRTKEVVGECLETVGFMKKVQEYASDEIDKRLYKSIKFWISIILTTFISTIITMMLKYLFFAQR